MPNKNAGMMDGAHPTAPGGMSRDALVDELVAKHGWDQAAAGNLTWVQQIEAVIKERLAREREAGPVVFEMTKMENAGRYPEEDGDDQPQPAAGLGAPTSLFLGMPDTQDYIFDGHAGAGPSGAERWMNCTASLAASRAFLETLSPNQQAQFAGASTAARQGTTAHAVGEAEALVLLGRMDQSELDMTLMELAIEPDDGEQYDEEMAEYITEYTDLIKMYADTRGPENILIEQRVMAVVPLTDPWDEDSVHEVPGSGDLIVLPTDEEPVLVVGDLKYGDGIHVTVDENPQVRIYALGALALLVDDEGCLTVDIERIDYHIIQPRLGGVSTWSETVEDLLTWRDEVLSPALSLALAGPEGGATYAPEPDVCQWCPARGGCAALAEQRMREAADLFDVIVEAEFDDGPGAFPETGSLTDTRLGELYAQITGLTKIKDDLKEEVQRRLHRGGTVPGFQLVSYTPPRKWSETAIEALDPDLVDEDVIDISTAQKLWARKLLTPTQALLVLKKDGIDGEAHALVESLVDSPEKRPVVAPVGDRRKTWTGVPPEQMFPDMTEEEA